MLRRFPISAGFTALATLAVLAVTACLFTVAHAAGMPAGLSPENPLLTAPDGKSITVYAVVNGKFFFTPTRHAVISKDGKYGDMAVFKGFVAPKDFHAALLALGARPGENMTLANKEATHVEGDELAVTVSWAGDSRDHALDEVIRDSNGKPIVIRFGGNLATSLDKNTGCLICLDSCPVGISSNATYTYGAVETRHEVAFTGNKDVLPADGTPVAITIRVKK
jgi:ferredoxin